MNILELVTSVSKIAIGAFVITLIVVGYEVFLLMRRKHDQENLQPHDENIVLPEFNNTVKEGTFSPVAVGTVPVEPMRVQSRKISKPFLGLLLGLLILIVFGTGYLVYRRNQVSTGTIVDVTPVTRLTPTSAVSPTPALPTAQPTAELTLIPTLTASTTPEPTGGLTPTGALTPTTPAMVTGGVTGSTTTITGTPVPKTTLPQAGTYQSTLLISVVAIAIIYLALIL